MTDNAKKFFVRPWHYAVNRVTAGPVEFATIQQLWNDEEIGPSTLVWQKGSTIGWKKIKKLPDLHQFLTETKQSNMKLRSDNSTASSSRQHSPHALADTRLSRRHQVPLQQSATDLDRSETSRSASPHPLRMREPSSAVIPDGAETDQNWFYVTFDKKSCGPITLMEMREAFQDAKNNLGRETLIWHPEKLGQTWRQAEDVEGVWDYLERKVARRRRGRIGHKTTPNGGFEMAKIRVLQRGMIESRESRGYSTTISEIKHRWLYVDKTLRRRGPVNNKKLTEIWKTSKHLDEHCVVSEGKSERERQRRGLVRERIVNEKKEKVQERETEREMRGEENCE
ncbi:hypothetical protein AAMO2058_001358700 [Amorphochlora amoebiformis]